MSLVLIVWLVNTVIPGLKGLAVMAMLIIIGTLLMMAITQGVDNNWKPIKKLLSYWWVGVLILLSAVLIPNKETTWYMVGAYGTQKLIDNPETQALASDGVDILKALMKKAKDNLSKEEK